MQIFGKPNGTLNILRVQWKTQLEIFYRNWISESFSDRDLTIGFPTAKMDLVKVSVLERKSLQYKLHKVVFVNLRYSNLDTLYHLL